MDLKVGDVCEGTVTGITKYGAFVSLGDGKSGLVHISEIADTYVSDVSAFLSLGQAVKVRITGIDPDGKIRLSIKRAADRPGQSRPAPSFRAPSASSRPAPAETAPAAAEPKSEKASLDDMLKRFMSESNANFSSVGGKQRSGYERRSAKKPGRRNYDD